MELDFVARRSSNLSVSDMFLERKIYIGKWKMVNSIMKSFLRNTIEHSGDTS